MERKLSTILASDVVGFSKMMSANEEHTLRDLNRRRQVIDGSWLSTTERFSVQQVTASLQNSRAR